MSMSEARGDQDLGGEEWRELGKEDSLQCVFLGTKESRV